MKDVRAHLLILPTFWASCVLAQIGGDEAECRRTWGEPTHTEVSEDGTQTVVFTNGNLRLEMAFLNGVAHRISCSKPVFNEQDIGRLLQANTGGYEWHERTQGGRDPNAALRRSWLRSDEMAMASLDEQMFTIVDGTWNQRHRAALEAAQSQTNEAPARTTQLVPEVSHPPGMVYHRAPILPPQRPQRPSVLPSIGDSREDVIRLLGRPKGAASGGRRTILSYGWGQVALIDDKVVARP